MKKTILILIVLGFISCTREIVSYNDSLITTFDVEGETNTIQDLHIAAKMNGVDLLIKEELIQFGDQVRLGYASAQGYQTITGENQNRLNYSPSLYHLGDDKSPSMGIRLIGFVNNPTETTVMTDLFHSGILPLSKDDYELGAAITYTIRGENDIVYTSMGAQSDTAIFKITAVEPSEYCDNGHICQILRGNFTCRLYNQKDSSDYIDVTNGVFKLRIQSKGSKY